ncbi:MAG: hydantoinase/oxoprolinase family protein [Hyphomicrobium sp.]
MAIVAGYDVGGAHLKVARIEDGHVTAVRVIACPLWLGIDRLDTALAEAAAVTSGATVHAATMTGELTEIFSSRAEGVREISDRLGATLGDATRIFRGLKGFGDVATAGHEPDIVGSANFLATAMIVARLRPKCLLIDFGSTTTDIVDCDRPQGLTDAERLQTGELVYTGFTRTSVAAVTQRAPLLGQWQGLARDAFASMADVRRVLGELPDGVDLHATADGRGISLAESLARLARGFGRDADMRHLATWRIAAAHIREAQVRSIADGVAQVLSRPGSRVTDAIAAGIGAPVAAIVAHRAGLACTTFGTLIGGNGDVATAATHAAPAVAVGLLASAP